MIEIFGVAASRARRVLWVAEECGLEYELRTVRPNTEEARDPAFLAINPNGRVPAMRHGELVLFESAAIAQYLARLAPDAGLLPTDAGELARHDQWMFWLNAELEQPLWTLAKHTNRLPEELRCVDIGPACHFEFQRHVAVLGDALEGREFLVGDTFTVADAFAAHTLLWARGVGAELPDDLVRYMKLHRGRPAFEATRRWD